MAQEDACSTTTEHCLMCCDDFMELESEEEVSAPVGVDGDVEMPIGKGAEGPIRTAWELQTTYL
jgi:hypothetical protein